MSECTDCLCKFHLVKFKDIGDVTITTPAGGPGLNAGFAKQELEIAARRAAEPSDLPRKPSNVDQNSKCPENCYCVPMGQPRWNTDDKGTEQWHGATITHEYTDPNGTYKIEAPAQACDGIQDGKCKSTDDKWKYTLAMAGGVPGLGISFTVADPNAINDEVVKKLRELEELG